MENNFCFMAFGVGQESVATTPIKRYIGVGAVKVLAVNPKKDELEKIYGITLDKEPEYLSTTEVNGITMENVRIDFIVKTDEENVDFTTKITFFIRKQYRTNRDNTKVQVIDKYGRTVWVTKEQCQNHEIPMYSNGPANIDKDYRPCFVGEEELTNFIKAYLCINNVMRYVNNTWIMVDNPDDCEARLDSIEKYFKNDFSELQGLLKLQPNNKVKALFGVRNTDDNRQYQTVYTQMFLRNSAYDYSKLNEDLQKRKAAGAYSTTEFEVCDLKEYVVTPTDFSKETTTESADNTPWGF